MEGLRNLLEDNLLPAAAGKLPIIADLRQVHYISDIALRDGMRMLNHAHPNTGMIIVVAPNHFVATMAAVFMRFYSSSSMRLVASMEEAEATVDVLLAAQPEWQPQAPQP